MTDRNFKPDSGTDLVFEDAGSTDRLRITDGGATILYEDGGAAALTINTDGNTVIADGNRIQTDEVRAYDGAGLKLYDDGGSGIFVEDGGNVGIGTSAPEAFFHIKKGDSTRSISSDADELWVESIDGDVGMTFSTNSDSYDSRINFSNQHSTGDGYIHYDNGDRSLKFGAGNNIRMRVSSTGNVGIPTVNASHKLQVTGSAGLSTGTAWTNTSDKRIKTNIKTIENALGKINQLRPVSYNYSKDYLDQHPELNPGISYNSFLAQEYEQVFPDAVSVGENLEKITVEAVEEQEAVLDKDGNEISPAVEAVEEVREILVEDMLQFTPHDLNMYLVGAVQELSAKVTALENA